MLKYPSIVDTYASYYGRKCIAFYKYDGSNLRFEWNPKSGWSKFGTRHQLFDGTHELYGQAIPIFREKYADRLNWAIKHDPLFKHSKKVTVFAEFFGPSSFAGEHKLSEPKDLKLFDINNNKGFIDPETFVSKFKHIDIAQIMYEGILTPEFARQIKTGQDERIFEGVICKGGEGHKLWMCKIKSRLYLEKLQQYEVEKHANQTNHPV